MEDFETWAKKWCPQVLKGYERSKIPFDSLVPGTKVITLRAGFGGDRGLIRVIESAPVAESWGRYLLLKTLYKECADRYILSENDESEGPWYLQVLPIQDWEFENFQKMTTLRQTDAWLEGKLGVNLFSLNRFISPRSEIPGKK